MNLIAIETATDVCGVALLQGSHVTVDLNLARPRAHAENLVLLIRDALHYGGISRTDLDAVAVSMGPGSYTGLRIGVSAAKGLAVALGIKLVGVPTLEALAASVLPVARPGDVICAALNARRNEVYAAASEVRPDGTLESLAETNALIEEDIPAWFGNLPSGTVWIVGDGGPKAAAALEEQHTHRVRLLQPALHPPSAAWIARLGLHRLELGMEEDTASFEPFYLKEFVAKKRERSIFERLPF